MSDISLFQWWSYVFVMWYFRCYTYPVPTSSDNLDVYYIGGGFLYTMLKKFCLISCDDSSTCHICVRKFPRKRDVEIKKRGRKMTKRRRPSYSKGWWQETTTMVEVDWKKCLAMQWLGFSGKSYWLQVTQLLRFLQSPFLNFRLSGEIFALHWWDFAG